MLIIHRIMQSRIETLPEKKLVDKKKRMSLVENRTRELWQGFMPHRKEIGNTVSTDLYSLEVYNDSLFFRNFNPTREFEKWAAVEVNDFDHVPHEMETITLPTGLYAVFIHKGSVSDGPRTYEYIFRTWLPQSDFELDNRPHFALMGGKYKNDDPDSEEEI